LLYISIRQIEKNEQYFYPPLWNGHGNNLVMPGFGKVWWDEVCFHLWQCWQQSYFLAI